MNTLLITLTFALIALALTAANRAEQYKAERDNALAELSRLKLADSRRQLIEHMEAGQ